MIVAHSKPKMTVKKVQKQGDELLIFTQHGNLKIVPYSDTIIRVVYTLEENYSDVPGVGLVPITPHCSWDWKEDTTFIVLSTDKVNLIINKETCAIAYYDVQGRLLVKEPDQGGKMLERYDAYQPVYDAETVTEKIMTPDGEKLVVKEGKKQFYKQLYHTRLEFIWSKGEAIYGLGQQQEGSLNLRGTRQYIHQANLKVATPFLLSTNGYGILFNTYSPMIFNDNEYGSYIYNEAANEMDFYFVYGENFDQIIRGYRTLTGKATMLPMWAFGYMQSQERYETQDEILHTIKEYRRRNIPIDSIVLDWMSWEDGQWGQKSFDQSRFPEVEIMMQRLHEQGAHFMISIWPNMVEGTENHKEMQEEDCLLGNSPIYNVFKEKARRLYWKQANEGLFSKGIDAWWCDSSEPVTPEWGKIERPEPDQNYMSFHNDAKNIMPEEYTNAYSLLHSRAIYEGQRSTTTDKRVVNLTRSGMLGQQKYGTIVWSGDTSATWKTLQNQIPAGLSFCASGLPYWTLDIGGFFVKKGNNWFWNGDFEGGCEDLGYRELYTRWFQYGAFLPIFRSHGTDTRREVWNFGEKGDIYYDTLVKFIELRMTLLPYIYSMSGLVTHQDKTMLRLLAFDFMKDPNVYEVKDQFMFGESLMVCPVTTPMYYGPNSTPLEGIAKTRQVYLPAGADWYDYWTNEKYEGGQTMIVQADITKIPLYVKAGSIIPTAEVAQCSKDSSKDHFILQIYPGSDAQLDFYQDEGDNYNYEQGQYTITPISWNDRLKKVTIGDRIGSFPGMPEKVTMEVKIMQ